MSEPTITHDNNQYRISVDGVQAGVADYVDSGDQRDFHHTEIDKAFGGQGLASKLIAAALADTKAAGRKIVPSCSFVQAYVAKHPEYAD